MTIKQASDWGGNYSRFSYDELDAYVALLQEQGLPVLDDEFNFLQDALLTGVRRAVIDVFGNGTVNNGFLIVGTSAANDFAITGGNGTADGAGSIWLDGLRAILASNTSYLGQAITPPALTTPASPRTDAVYLDAWLTEVGPSEDTTIIDPTIGTETSRRLKLAWQVLVAEGAAAPAGYTDANGAAHYTLLIAEIARTAQAAIDAGMVTDKRPRGYENLPQATETQRGIVELATSAETVAGTDAVRAVTPATLPQASTTQKGIVELATSAETTAGTDAVRAVTPATLPQASTTQKGIVELATSAETVAGTDAVRAVTPAGLATVLSGVKDVAVISGVVNDGQTVPLPTGYSEGQTHTILSMQDTSDLSGQADNDFDRFQCFMGPSRACTCRFEFSTGTVLATANYLVIGIK